MHNAVMTGPSGQASLALERFVERARRLAQQAGSWPPRVEHDPEWPLRCAVGVPDEDGSIAWEPTARAEPRDFVEVERAIGPLHPHVKELFGSRWSLTLGARHGAEVVYLATIENEERERAMLAGWVSAGPGAPILIAHFGDDRWLGVDPSTGRITLEDPPRASVPIAASIPEWLDALEPVPRW